MITEAEPFPAGYPQAAAAVNGFGYGGTNAHAILVEAPEPTPAVDRQAPPVQVLPVSGRNEVGARQLAQELLSLVSDPTVDPAAMTDGHVVATLAPQLSVRRAVQPTATT